MKQSSIKPFSYYNNYYDLLYHDKDYQREADFVVEIIRSSTPDARNLLEVGCGTGNYSKIFTESGFTVTGVEISKEMADVALEKNIPNFKVINSDISEFETGEMYDGAVALFHVISYITDTSKLLASFSNINKHLKPNSVFVFDVWYTPAVYLQHPQKRVKEIKHDGKHITRIATPFMHYENNTVDVNYDMTIKGKDDTEEMIQESHTLRHFTTPEIILLATLSGFKFIRSEEFLTGKTPGSHTWGVCYTLQKHG